LVWGAEGEDQGAYLRVFISGLRKKLEPAKQSVVIETIGNLGYRLCLKSLHVNAGLAEAAFSD
jgi:DNA-binding response OmpR family regulator